jgi:hypothetical protein
MSVRNGHRRIGRRPNPGSASYPARRLHGLAERGRLAAGARNPVASEQIILVSSQNDASNLRQEIAAMPEKETIKRAQRDKREGKSASTQAGEFVREEMHHIREGKHGARSAKQAIAIGLSKARRAGVDLPPPEQGKVPEKTRKSAGRAWEVGQGKRPKRKPSARRSQATERALEREQSSAASHRALSRQAHSAAKQRTAKERSAAAKKAVQTKGHAGLVKAARKAARTRKAHGRS